MPLSVQEFADKVRERKPEYAHLDNADLIQMVTQKKPELLQSVDRQDLVKVSNESVSKQISKERQKQFGALSGYSRFMAGAGEGMLDTYNGIKQLFGGDTEEYKGDKSAYMDASKGSKTAAAGEVAGALAATAPTVLIPGAGVAGLASKVASPLAQAAIRIGAAGAIGAGYGATEFVDDGETRAKNAAIGALFGAGTAGAATLVKKVGTKAFNAMRGRYADASIQDLMDLSIKYDIPLSAGDVTGKGRSTEKALEGVPLVGMGRFRKEGAEKVQAAIKKEADAVSPAWDEVIQQSLADKSQSARAQAKINYDKVDELSSGISIKPQNAIDKAAEHEADIAGSIMGNEKNPFSKIRENLSKKDRTFTNLRRDRSALQEAADKADQHGDRNLARQYNDVKEGIESDIEKLVNKKTDVGTFSKTNPSINPQAKELGRPEGIGITNETGMLNAPDPKGIGYENKSGSSLSNISTDGIGPRVEIGTRAKKPDPLVGGFERDAASEKAINTQDQRLKEAFHTAQEQYKRDVVPYNKTNITNAIKTENPDEIFKKFVQKGNGDRAGGLYDLLDDKGKSAFKDGLIDNAIKGATNQATGDVSPKKLSNYLYKLSNPIESTLKGADREQVLGLAKIMHHAERYGQLNESPSNGMAMIPYLKALALTATGYGGAVNPVGTAAAVAGAGALTKIASLMKTKGYKVALASDKIGSPAFEKAITEIIDQLPKAAAVTGKELKD